MTELGRLVERVRSDRASGAGLSEETSAAVERWLVDALAVERGVCATELVERRERLYRGFSEFRSVLFSAYRYGVVDARCRTRVADLLHDAEDRCDEAMAVLDEGWGQGAERV